MNIFEQLKNKFGKKAFEPLENIDLNQVVGWRTIGGSTIFGYYQDKQYENGYSSISKLANGFAIIEPWTIDKNGNSVPSNILDRVYTPNTDMSAYDFREALAVTSLVHDKVLLQVHHRGTRINADSITGFTFMEDYSEKIVDNKRIYTMANGEVLGDDSVITLKSINPENINEGFSPSRAARRWTRLDDYIADYQKGFFENGAVPSGQLIITARTQTEFNDIVDTLQARHRGASKNNNITYTHRPTDQNGSPLNSQIEWVPFSTPNKDMALKDLFDNVNKKIDSVYGVPEEIRGHLANSNYASVAVAEKVFVKYALAPMTLKIWNKFNHELNRITGGTGVALTYKLEIPIVADEEKVRAEAKQVESVTITGLTTAGYTLASAIDYVKNGNIDALKFDKPAEVDLPDTTDPDEIKDTPVPVIDVYAKRLNPKQLSDADRTVAEMRIKDIARKQIDYQVNRAIENLDEVLASKAFGDASDQQDEVFIDEMMRAIIPVVLIYGGIQTMKGAEMLYEHGISTDNIQRFALTPKQTAAYRKYLKGIATYFNEQTAEGIRRVLNDGITRELTRIEIEKNLRGLITQQWRIDRLAISEINRAEGRSAVMAMSNIMEQTKTLIQKTMQHSGADNPCEYCAARLGDWYTVDEPMVKMGEVVRGLDGGEYINSWEDNYGNDIHANGHCTPIFRVVGE